jgi:hypothetical protein
MRFRTASFRGLAAAAVVLFGAHDFTLAASLPATVVYENISRFDVTWTGSFPDGVNNSLDTPALTFWSVGPSPITLTYQGGGAGWLGTITGQHIQNPHPSPEIALGDLETFNVSFPNASGTQTFDSGWQYVVHAAIPHWDRYRLTYSYVPGLSTFSAQLQGIHVPEIDPATGSSALSLVAGVLAMIEQQRRRAALVA